MFGFRALINSHGDAVGVDHISRKKPSSYVPIDKPPANADELIGILKSMNITPEEKPRIENVIYAMNWSEKAKSIISEENSTNKAIIMFSPGRIDGLKNLYQNANIDDNNLLLGDENDKKIIDAIKELEESKMWISSLQTNPDCEFVAIVLRSLHKRISIEHDDDVILGAPDQGESCGNAQERGQASNDVGHSTVQKRGSASVIDSSKENNSAQKRRRSNRFSGASQGTGKDCVSVASEGTPTQPAKRRSPRKSRG